MMMTDDDDDDDDDGDDQDDNDDDDDNHDIIINSIVVTIFKAFIVKCWTEMMSLLMRKCTQLPPMRFKESSLINAT